MSGRREVRRRIVCGGVVLLAALVLAPRVPPLWVIPLSIVWYLALGVLLWSAVIVLAQWTGRRAALPIVTLGALAPILLTAVRAPPAVALRLPCHRNWLWLPTWFLRSSPMGSLRFEVGDARVKLCYGRPALRGRRMLGGSRVAYGRLWRTGANEPTTVISTRALEVAGLTIPEGRTALYTIPGPESWELILNGSTSQWGIESEYTAAVRAHELGHAILPSERGARVERLRFATAPEAGGDSDRVDLVLSWDSTRVRIPVRAVLR